MFQYVRKYAKSYLALALYILATWFMDINFWQVSRADRPLWLIGALLVLLLAVFWKKAPEQRPHKSRH